jgi:hypothetical protein
MRALVQRLALVALMLALLAPRAAAPTAGSTPARDARPTHPVPARRRATDISTQRNYFKLQPMLGCANVTRAALPAGAAPACCTVTSLDCAKRCVASPDCSAFRFAYYSDTQPSAADAPPGALPGGASWSVCELLSDVDVASCTPQLEIVRAIFVNETKTISDISRYPVWESPAAKGGATFFDMFWRSLLPAQTEVWQGLSVRVSTPDAASLLVNRTTQSAFAAAVVWATSALGCATFADVLSVNQSAATPATAQQAAGQADEVLVTLQVQAVTGRYTNASMAKHIADVLASAEGEAALLTELLAGGFASPIMLSISAGDGQPSALLPSAATKCSAADSSGAGFGTAVVVGLAVGLGGALVLAAAAVLLRRYELAPRACTPGGERGAAGHDVFMSYRRVDLAVADAVHDKLVLAGLRVFYDRGGQMAGKPFEQELFRAIHDAPCFAPIITLEMMRVLASHRGDTVDYVLAELLVAMHYARAGRVQLIFPLLVGEWTKGSAASGGGERDYMPANPTFLQLRESVPAVVPAATLALVNSLFAAAGEGETLDADLAAATVRELILGRGDEALVGVLEMTGCALSGPEEQAGLVLRHRYADRILLALAPQQPPSDSQQRKRA